MNRSAGATVLIFFEFVWRTTGCDVTLAAAQLKQNDFSVLVMPEVDTFILLSSRHVVVGLR